MISIIIPNYNKSQFLSETINSVKKQTYDNWEAIIIDDCSSDNSVDIIEKLISNDNKFSLKVNFSNKGANYSRNLGIKEAKGDFIIFLDSDDILSNDCLKNRIEFFRESSNIDFAVFCMGSFNEVIGDNTFLWNKFEGNIVKRFLSHDLPWALPSILWNKSSLEMLKGFDESFKRYQDVELHLRALLNDNINYAIQYSNNADCYYRISDERFGKDYFRFIQNKKNGVLHFISFFESYLKDIGNHKRIKYLKLTFFQFLSDLFFYYRKSALTLKEVEKVMDDIFKREIFILLFSSKDIFFLKLYINLSKRKIHFKGLSLLIKKSLIL
ncbi:MAG: glycosyltransferase family 2 protein [Flavobacteriaceae bacterium]